MAADSERSGGFRPPTTDNHPSKPSAFFLAGAAERIKQDPLNIKVLSALALANSVADAAVDAKIDRVKFSILYRNIRGIMGPSVRSITEVVAFALDPNAKLLDAEAISARLHFERHNDLKPKDQDRVDALTDRRNWSKTQEELAAMLENGDMEEYGRELRRLCALLGVGNLMQLRVFELLRPKTTVEVTSGLLEPLTAQEIEVVERKARGLTNKQVGTELGMSVKIATQHLNEALEKGREVSLIRLIANLIKAGIIDKEELKQKMNLNFPAYAKLDATQQKIFALVTSKANLSESLAEVAANSRIKQYPLNKGLVNIYAILGVRDIWQLRIYSLLLPDEIRNASSKEKGENQVAEKDL